MSTTLDTANMNRKIPDQVLDNTDPDVLDRILNSEEEYNNVASQFDENGNYIGDLNELIADDDGDTDGAGAEGAGASDDNDGGSEAGGEKDDGSGDADGGDTGTDDDELDEGDIALAEQMGLTIKNGKIEGRFRSWAEFGRSYHNKQKLIGMRLNDLAQRDPAALAQFIEDNRDALEPILAPLIARRQQKQDDGDGERGAESGKENLTRDELYRESAEAWIKSKYGDVDAQLKLQFEGRFQKKGIEFSLDEADIAELEEAEPALYVELKQAREQLSRQFDAWRSETVKALQYRDKLRDELIPQNNTEILEKDRKILVERYGYTDELLDEVQSSLALMLDDPEQRDVYFKEAFPGSGMFQLRERALYRLAVDPDAEFFDAAVEAKTGQEKKSEKEFYAKRRVKANASSIEGMGGRSDSAAGLKGGVPTPEQMHDTRYVDSLSDEELQQIWTAIDQMPSDEQRKYR